jgi:xylan 1,4-beta-xylosidase
MNQPLLALLFSAASASLLSAASPDGAPERTIRVSFTHVKGPHNTAFGKCIGAGRANEGLRADWQEQLALLQREIGFDYIRMHGLLHDDMGVYRENAHGEPVYNWQYIDVLYDRLLALGIRPFVELSFMPHDLASGPQTIFWWKGNVTPPKSYQKWGALIHALAAHFQERYGDEEVRKWYFEVWNEPDIGFWTGSQADYLRLYRVTAEAVKSVSPAYRVGGPAVATNGPLEEELLRYCAANHVPIDFVSAHSYGVTEGFVDETGTHGTVLSADRTAVRARMLESRQRLNKSPLPGLELHFTEWSSSYTPTDPIHDQYHQAPFILDKVKGVEGVVDSLSYWVFSDIFEENGPRATPFHGGFGLLNYQGIRKPAYYAFEFMRRLGDLELANSDDSSWVCRNQRGDVQALLWDFTPIQPPAGVNDQTWYRVERPAKDKGTARVVIEDLPEGHYRLRVLRTGYRVNDPYTAWLDLGAPSQLTKAQVRAISEVTGSPAADRLITHPGGTFETTFVLRENDVYLMTLDKL